MSAPAPDLDDAQAEAGPISNLEACARVVAKLIVDRYINSRHIHAAATPPPSNCAATPHAWSQHRDRCRR